MGKSAGDLLLDVHPERLEHGAAGRLARDASDLRQGGGERDRLEDALASLPVFVYLAGTLFTDYLAAMLFTVRASPILFGSSYLLQLRGRLLPTGNPALGLVLALLALAARVLHDLSQNSPALLHLHVEEE